MNEPRPGTAHAALDLLTRMQARAVAEDFEGAACFILVVTDLDHGIVSYSGVYRDPVAALMEAERWEAELNAGGTEPGDLGYRIKVAPVSPHDNTATIT